MEQSKGDLLRISVVVPVYQAEQYLPRCVESVLSQTEQSFELILVDDGSADGSGELCRSYAAKDDRVRVISQTNQGVSAARQAGMKAARAEYIAFVDADDYVESDYLEQMLHHTFGGAAVVCCNSIDEGDHGQTNYGIRERQETDDPETLLNLYFEDQRFAFVVWAKLFRRDILQKLHFVNLRRTEDMHLMLECMSLGVPFVLIPYEGYHYVANDSSVMATSRLEDVYRDNLVSLDYLCSICSRISPALTEKAKRKLLWVAYVAVSVHFKYAPAKEDGAFREALRVCDRWLTREELRGLPHGRTVALVLRGGKPAAMILRLLYQMKERLKGKKA